MVLITTDRDQLARWFRYFSGILNPTDTKLTAKNFKAPTLTFVSHCSSISSSPLNVEEIEAAIKQLKLRKASGGDMISPEALKAELQSPQAISLLFLKQSGANNSYRAKVLRTYR